MPLASSSLTMVSIDGGNAGDAFKEMLLEFGFALRVTPPHRVIVKPKPTDPSMLIVFAGDTMRSGVPMDRIIRAVQCVPSLVVVSDKIPLAIEPILEHCTEFCRWPCPPEQIELRIRRLGRSMDCDVVADNAPKSEGVNSDPVDRMIGESESFSKSMKQVYAVAPHDSPVFLTGETGTGKELTARAIHYLSPRKDGPFIPVNCAALPDSIIESEMFGHQAGAYTDAKSARKGLFEQANGGTLFLDEIETLSVHKGQVILLRVLEDRMVRPVGSDRSHRVDIRIVAATNANISDLIERQQFRGDLYYRLNILNVKLTALRHRDRDIALLSSHFLKLFSAQYGFEKRLSQEGMRTLMSYPWPGNVRELENYLHREYLQQDSQVLHCDSLMEEYDEVRLNAAPTIASDVPFQEAKKLAIETFEKTYLIGLIRRSKGNISRAARMAGKERRALGKLIKKHGIEVQEFRV